jgi:hypothetical protein
LIWVNALPARTHPIPGLVVPRPKPDAAFLGILMVDSRVRTPSERRSASADGYIRVAMVFLSGQEH